jgi:hypothetical protein
MFCPYTFGLGFHAKVKFGRVKHHGINGHWDICRSTKAFIMVVANGLGNNDAHALSFYFEFYYRNPNLRLTTKAKACNGVDHE